MKTKPLFILILLAALAGCSGKTETSLQHVSPNKKVKIDVEGKRSTSVEAWKVEMKVNAYGFKQGKLAFEVYAGDLNSENVLFKWEDETHCTITFIQTDSEELHFQLIASPEQLQMGAI